MTPVTVDDVVAWGDIKRALTTEEEAVMELVVDVCTTMVTQTCVALDETTPDTEQDMLMGLAVRMQAFRLWKRRATPEGISAVFDGITALRVQGTDPDIKRMLDFYKSWGVA